MEKKPDMYTAITPTEMMTMIGDFADGLMYHMKERGTIDTEQVNEAFKRMTDMFNTMGMHPWVAIIVMLLGAVTMFEYATVAQDESTCRYLN